MGLGHMGKYETKLSITSKVMGNWHKNPILAMSWVQNSIKNGASQSALSGAMKGIHMVQRKYLPTKHKTQEGHNRKFGESERTLSERTLSFRFQINNLLIVIAQREKLFLREDLLSMES
ncbi:hypothetical protein ACJX0J_016486, partial [Zea mays]